MKNFFKEFKKFAMRGSVMDLAVGMMIGSAFSAIVTSLVNDLISPLIGLIVRADFSDLAITIGGVAIKYGSFLMALVNFVIVAFALFVLVKTLNRAAHFRKRKVCEEAPKTKVCPFCKTEIDINASRCPHCTSHFLE